MHYVTKGLALHGNFVSKRGWPNSKPQPTPNTANMKPTITTETAYGDTLSISELFSAHPGERLYIHPLLWTRRHLDLLGCEFSDDGILSPPPPSPSISPPPPGVGDNGEVTWVERYHLELYSDTNKARCLATGKRVYDKCWSLSRLLGFEYCRYADPSLITTYP